MYGGMRITTSAKASRSPWISSTVIGRRPPVAADAGRAELEAAARRPADRGRSRASLDQHDIAVPQARPEGVERGLGVADVLDAVRREPAAQGALDDPAASCPRRPAGRRSAAAASPTAWWPAVVLVAELEHLAEDGDAATRAGRPAGRARPAPTGRGVVGVIDHGHAAAGGRPPPDGAPTSRRASARTIVVQRQPGGEADRRAGEGVVDRQPAERRDRTSALAGRCPQSGSASRRARATSTTTARDVGVRRRSRSAGPGGRPAAHPADDRVIGIEDRRPVRRQRLERARPSPARSPRACRSATRWTAWTAVTTPIDGRPMAARSAISPPTYMPISRTAASCSGPRRRSGQRQADLVVLVALAAQRPERGAEDGRDRLLGRGLGDAPGHADDERVEPAPPAGGHRTERRAARRRPGRPSRRRGRRARRTGRVTRSAAAPRATASAR